MKTGNMIPYIYMYTDNYKNKVCYVGKHCGADKNYFTGSKILRRYKKIFGLKQFKLRFSKSIVEYCDRDSVNDREVYWISFYKTYEEGLNLTKGGDFDWKYKVSKRYPVLKYDLEGNFIESYPSMREASLANGDRHGTISEYFKKNYRSSLGFMWRLQITLKIDKKIKPIGKPKSYKTKRKSNSTYAVDYNGILFRSIASFKLYMTGTLTKAVPLHHKTYCKLYQRIIIEKNSGHVFETLKEASNTLGIPLGTLSTNMTDDYYKHKNLYIIQYELVEISMDKAPQKLFTKM